MKTNLVILAAGNSSRFGSNKLLSDWRGQPLIQHVFKMTQNLSFNEVIVVSQYDEVLRLASAFHIKTVFNTQPEQGMSHSLHLAIQQYGDCEQMLFMVADQPLLKSSTLLALLQASDGNQIVCCQRGNSIQNPMLFPARYFAALLMLKGDEGGKKIALQEAVKRIVVDECELFDIDTMIDYEKALHM